MIARIRRWKELDRWIPGGPDLPEFAHPLVPLEELVSERRERVALRGDLGAWTPITIHFDGTIEQRKRDKPFKGAMFAAYPGDLVLSKIDARNGAIGLVPDAFKQVVITSEYPVHIPDAEQVDSHYLTLVLRAPDFLLSIKTSATGTSGRKRITPESFRAIKIPIPELPDQRQLVNSYRAALVEVEKLRDEAEAVERRAAAHFETELGLAPRQNLPQRRFQIASFRDCIRWSHEGILQRRLQGDSAPESTFDFVPLGEVGKVSYGIQKSPSNRPGRHARPYLRVANVQRGFLDLRQIKLINVPDEQMPSYRLEPGDVLLCEGNSEELVGRGAIWNGEIADCVHQNHVLRVRLDRKVAHPEYVLECINSSLGQSYFRSKAKRTTNLASINSREVADMPLPLPPLEVQERITSEFQAARNVAEKLRRESAELRSRAWQDFVTAIYS